jgi:hypothetical protein
VPGTSGSISGRGHPRAAGHSLLGHSFTGNGYCCQTAAEIGVQSPPRGNQFVPAPRAFKFRAAHKFLLGMRISQTAARLHALFLSYARRLVEQDAMDAYAARQRRYQPDVWALEFGAPDLPPFDEKIVRRDGSRLLLPAA